MTKTEITNAKDFGKLDSFDQARLVRYAQRNRYATLATIETMIQTQLILNEVAR